MFYQFADDITTVDIDEIDSHYITAGYVTLNEFEKIYSRFGFAGVTLDCCKEEHKSYYCVTELYDDYIFAVIKIKDAKNSNDKSDCFALYVKKNIILVVDIEDGDCSVRDNFFAALKRYSSININLGKIIYAFFNEIIKKDNKIIEDTEFQINNLEELVLKNKADKNFNFTLLGMKKELLIFRNYYEQIIDVGEAMLDNENEIFEPSDLKYLLNFTEKVKCLRESIETLRNSIIHLQEAYSAYLDLKLNQTMKFFTVVTTVFFPLTVIVGWYGMNFNSMPELKWKYGYLFVILLSFAVVAGLMIVFKKKKWI